MHDRQLQSGAPTLLADIGGTNARFALTSDDAAQPLQRDSVRIHAVADFPSLADAARHYLDEAGVRVAHAVFAVAGRVDGDTARITNHPWLVSRSRIVATLGLAELALVNDFAAQAMAVPLLGPGDIAAIGAPQASFAGAAGDRCVAVIGPGTGLGVGALLVRDGRAFALESEGGHVGFAPRTPEEIAILEHMSARFGRVSVERLVSGPGLVNIHRALSELGGQDPGTPSPADITAGAAAGDQRCMRAVDVFCAVLGAAAGDLVLTLGAWTGVYLAGGLVPRMLDALHHSAFRARFEEKGRFAASLARVPSLAVMHADAGLLGAAAIAARTPAGVA
jgi:glucokinase